MKQYLDLMERVLNEGYEKKAAREGMPSTREIFGAQMRFNLQEGFPLLTTKKMYTKGIITELLWFLKGYTNIQYLVENGVHIWDKDAYKYYLRLHSTYIHSKKLSEGEFFSKTYLGQPSDIPHYKYGDVGHIYSFQWNNWNGSFNQIQYLIENIKENPDSRYHLVTAWNPSDYLATKYQAALPACHILFQCSVREGKYLDLSIIQRSCDLFLGVPFNIASYALLTHIIAKSVDLEPGELIWTGNSIHLYSNHLEQAREQIKRQPFELPQLIFNRIKADITLYQPQDFIIKNYKFHPAIKAELSVGI